MLGAATTLTIDGQLSNKDDIDPLLLMFGATSGGFSEINPILQGILGGDEKYIELLRYQCVEQRKDSLLDQGVHCDLPDMPGSASAAYRQHAVVATMLCDEALKRHEEQGTIDVAHSVVRLRRLNWRDKIISTVDNFLIHICGEDFSAKRGVRLALQTLFFRDMGDDPFLDRSNMEGRLQKVRIHLMKIISEVEFTEKIEDYELPFTLESEDLVWLRKKMITAVELIPDNYIQAGAYSQLCFVMLGVTLEALRYKWEDRVVEKEKYVFKCMQFAYYLGLAYALVDNLMDNDDSDLLEWDKDDIFEMVCDLLQGQLIERGRVPVEGEIGDRIYGVLADFQSNFPYEENILVYRAALILHESQYYDQIKGMECDQEDRNIYPDLAIKAGMSRIVPFLAVGGEIEPSKMSFFLLQGILMQLRDDFIDFFEDMEAGVRTPFTLYARHGAASGITNPLMLIITISEMLIDEYSHYGDVSEIVYSKFVNNIRGIVTKYGYEKLLELMDVFCVDEDLRKTLLSAVNTPSSSDDLDFNFKERAKSIGRELKAKYIRLEEFISIHKPLIDAKLNLDAEEDPAGLKKASNYSLSAGGKRLRPLLTLMVGHLYEMDLEELMPLAIAIESAHTASLIFDDLPAQDDAPIRRGKPTLHIHRDEATAQLVGVGLISRAFETVSSLDCEPVIIREIVRYLAEIVGLGGLCLGQAMDLTLTRADTVNLEVLEKMSHFKTGLAIELSLIPAALIAGKTEDIPHLKAYAFHLGVAFQIQDDILDVVGVEVELGKKVGIDLDNNSASYVNVLGMEAAEERLGFHLDHARQAVRRLNSQRNGLLIQVIDHIKKRKK